MAKGGERTGLGKKEPHEHYTATPEDRETPPSGEGVESNGSRGAVRVDSPVPTDTRCRCLPSADQRKAIAYLIQGKGYPGNTTVPLPAGQKPPGVESTGSRGVVLVDSPVLLMSGAMLPYKGRQQMAKGGERTKEGATNVPG